MVSTRPSEGGRLPDAKLGESGRKTMGLTLSRGAHPEPAAGRWTIRDFAFHTGETLTELRLDYLTIGHPSGEPVLILHGSIATAASMVAPSFAGALFGRGQALDAARYFIIIPDSIGLGGSSKPSDGLRGRFPRYNYGDMVAVQHRLVAEHLGIRHLRLVIGNSMGGMHAWMWGVQYPHFMDALVPMACQPSGVAGRNQMMRRLAIETIRRDPGYLDGNYVEQPASLTIADAILRIGFNGGESALFRSAPSRAGADAVVDRQLAAPVAIDANDFIYRFDASRDYDPSPGLEHIEAAVLAINSADDERNPVELGIVQCALKRMKNARLHLIPAGDGTAGHGTMGNAALYAEELREFLRTVPRRTDAAAIGAAAS
jgi:homoserine O-acetyltransferase/O-succinyltransferase